MQYDVLVLGGGPAGYHAAIESAHKGFKTAVIEKEFIGGTCLKEGCIPTKTLLKSAELFHEARTAQSFGITAQQVHYDHAIALQRKEQIISQLNKGVIAKLKKAKVTRIEGVGTIQGHRDGYIQIACNDAMYDAKYLIISTGSSVAIPKIKGIENGMDDGFVLNSTQILALETLPKKLTIIGGGVIGIEMAELFSKLGVAVEMIEFQATIGGAIDTAIAKALQHKLTEQRVVIHTNAAVTEIQAGVVVFQKNGEQLQATADKVLICTGRKGNSKYIGLHHLGVEIENGFIKTNDCCQTNYPNVFAIGDINGKSMLAHTAYREAEVVVETIVGEKSFMNYAAIPNVIYTSPETAAVGLTEQQLQAQGIRYKAIQVPMYYSGRFLVEGSSDECFIKVLIDDKFKTIKGVHMVAPFASEILFGMSILVEQQLHVKQIKRVVIAHPTIAEVLKEVIHQYEVEVGLE